MEQVLSQLPAATMLETERLLLRKLTPDIYSRLFASYSEREIREYLGLKTGAEFKETSKQFELGLSTYFTTFANFYMLSKPDNRVVGRCDFHTWVPTHKRAEIGYHITDEAFRNKGLMTEALRAVLTYGFDTMGLYRVEAMASPNNIPSLQLLQRYGFKKEGHLRNHYMVNGTLEDSLLFSLLLPEFEAQKATWA
ncbi:GNAT family N-acetyltransferase [Pontibacter sp. CAU 1760]